MKDAEKIKLKNSISASSYLNPVNSIRYSSDVLISNWFETRYNEQSYSRGIVPCLPDDSKCIHAKSIYEQEYTPSMKNATELASEFVQWKNMGFHNNCVGRSSSISFLDSEEFMRNMTTTKTVFEKALRKPREYPYTETNKPKRGQMFIPEEDIMKSYGNNTKTGLIAWKRCTNYADRCRPKSMSIYTETYSRPLC